MSLVQSILEAQQWIISTQSIALTLTKVTMPLPTKRLSAQRGKRINNQEHSSTLEWDDEIRIDLQNRLRSLLITFLSTTKQSGLIHLWKLSNL